MWLITPYITGSFKASVNAHNTTDQHIFIYKLWIEATEENVSLITNFSKKTFCNIFFSWSHMWKQLLAPN